MPPTPRPRAAGFTLIEVMVAVAIIALLAAVALPAFQGSIRKSRRSDAINAINAVLQAQERIRANWTVYCGTLGAPASAGACGLNLPSTSAKGHYTLAISAPTATGHVVTATAAGSQSEDSSCAKLAAKMEDGAISYGSGASSVDWTDANKCWAK